MYKAFISIALVLGIMSIASAQSKIVKVKSFEIDQAYIDQYMGMLPDVMKVDEDGKVTTVGEYSIFADMENMKVIMCEPNKLKAAMEMENPFENSGKLDGKGKKKADKEKNKVYVSSDETWVHFGNGAGATCTGCKTSCQLTKQSAEKLDYSCEGSCQDCGMTVHFSTSKIGSITTDQNQVIEF